MVSAYPGGWWPRLALPCRSRVDLERLWARALTVQLGRLVTATEVGLAIRRDGWADAGIRPAVLRWLAVPPAYRFCPPGIDPRTVVQADVEMWLKVGSICEWNGRLNLRERNFDA